MPIIRENIINVIHEIIMLLSIQTFMCVNILNGGTYKNNNEDNGGFP